LWRLAEKKSDYLLGAGKLTDRIGPHSSHYSLEGELLETAI
jgi:hypothetical protein